MGFVTFKTGISLRVSTRSSQPWSSTLQVLNLALQLGSSSPPRFGSITESLMHQVNLTTSTINQDIKL